MSRPRYADVTDRDRLRQITKGWDPVERKTAGPSARDAAAQRLAAIKALDFDAAEAAGLDGTLRS